MTQASNNGKSVYSRSRVWTKAGVWEDILAALIKQVLDSTTIKVHQHASGTKKGGYHEETGQSSGVLNTSNQDNDRRTFLCLKVDLTIR